MRDMETEMSSTNSAATPRAQRGIPLVPDTGLQPAAAKVKWGWDAAAPPVPPLRARGAQGWPGPRGGGRAPPPAPSVPQVRVTPRGWSVRARS